MAVENFVPGLTCERRSLVGDKRGALTVCSVRVELDFVLTKHEKR